MNSMHIYYWKGKNHCGQKLKGKISAKNSVDLMVMLKQQGIISIHIRPEYSLIQILKKNLKKNKKPNHVDIICMIKQLSMLLSAHISLIQALEVIEQNTQMLTRDMLRIIHECRTQVQLGHTLSYALSRHPQYFNSFFCHWVEAGELSGTLDVLLTYWVSYQEKMLLIRQKVKKAIMYPAVILTTAVIVAMVLFIWVVPVFEKLFHQFDAELPKLTQYVIILSHLFRTVGIPVLIFLSISVGIFWGMRQRIPVVHYAWDKMILKIPLSGKIIQEAAIARLSRTLSIMLSAGFSLSDALQWTTKIMNNMLLFQIVSQLQTAVVSGITLSQAMSSSLFFPPLLKQMTAVGEASGTLDKTFFQTADFYEKNISHTLETMGELIEPIMMIVLGVIMSIFILAMYLPIFKLGALF